MTEDVPLIVNNELTEIDLSPYLAPLNNNKNQTFKYPFKVELEGDDDVDERS
jgi:hypothetical protein